MHGSLLPCPPWHLDNLQIPSHHDFPCFNCSVVSILGKRGHDHPRPLFSDSNTKPPASLCWPELTYSISLGGVWDKIGRRGLVSHQSRLIKYSVSLCQPQSGEVHFSHDSIKYLGVQKCFVMAVVLCSGIHQKSHPSLKNWCCFLPFHRWENWGGP